MSWAINAWAVERNKPKTPHSSRTPVLDLLEPLPKPFDEIVTGRLALPFLAFLGVIVALQNFSFLIVPIGFLLVVFLSVAIHELGHLIAGRCVGLRFVGVDIGPLAIRRIRQKWALRLRPRLFLGAAYMSLTRIRRMRRRLAICTMGGPIASYVFGIGAFVIGEMFRMSDFTGWTTFLEFTGFSSFFVGVMSTIPYGTSTGGNDARLLQLLLSKESSKQMMAAYALAFVAANKPITPEYHDRWWRLAIPDSNAMRSNYYREWMSYRNATDPTIAGEFLESLLRNSGPLPCEVRNFLAAEAAYFCAVHRENAVQSVTWFSRISHIEWFDPLTRLRLEVALAASQGLSKDALGKCDEGLSIIRANLSGRLSAKLQDEWTSWRNEIAATQENTKAELVSID